MTRGQYHQYYIYIMASHTGVLYVGMTNNLARRVHEHRTGMRRGFTKKYRTTRLIYYECTNNVLGAISREKQIKAWRRRKKLDLIRGLNPTFRDLGVEILGEWSCHPE